MPASSTDYVRLENETEMQQLEPIGTHALFQEYEREALMLFAKVRDELHSVEAGAPSTKAESMIGEIMQNKRSASDEDTH